MAPSCGSHIQFLLFFLKFLNFTLGDGFDQRTSRHLFMTNFYKVLQTKIKICGICNSKKKFSGESLSILKFEISRKFLKNNFPVFEDICSSQSISVHVHFFDIQENQEDYLCRQQKKICCVCKDLWTGASS